MEVTLHIRTMSRSGCPIGSDLSRRALEALLWRVQGGRLKEAQLRQLLGFQTRDALDGFLKSHESG